MIDPRTEAELATAVTEARGPLRIRGGGTRAVGQSAGEVLSVAGLTGVTLYEPGALTLVAAAGTPLAEIEATLAEHGQRLPFEPVDWRPMLGTDGVPTIGGAVAANISGPRRIQAGACRDSLIGVRFVDGTGTVVKNGGRVMKNVTGYDLVKLMAGSWGTLGVLTEVAFKVLPGVDAMATLTLSDLTPKQAVDVMSAALGSPYEVSGAAYVAGQTHLRLEGLSGSIAYRTGALSDLLSSFGVVSVERDPEAVKTLWTEIGEVRALAAGVGDIWRVSVKPTDGPTIVELSGAEDAQMDWGGGLIWVRVPEGTDVRARLGDFDGHATLIRGRAAGIPAFHPEPAPVAALTTGLRTRFDPRGILNPGLMAA